MPVSTAGTGRREIPSAGALPSPLNNLTVTEELRFCVDFYIFMWKKSRIWVMIAIYCFLGEIYG